MKILLANDTAVEAHLGCHAVSDATARLIGRCGHKVTRRIFLGGLAEHEARLDADILRSLESDEQLLADIDQAEAVVVNGEGTIHHGAGRPLLGLLELARKRRKAALLVNAVFQEVRGFEDTLAMLDEFTVREARSQAFAHRLGARRARVVPDLSFAAGHRPLGPSEQRTASGMAVTEGHWQRSEVQGILAALQQQPDACVFRFSAPDAAERWDRAVEDLRGADVLVTGRHHGICFALKAGIPFVALPSNTWKIEGLLELIGRPDLLVHTFEEVLAKVGEVRQQRARFASLIDRLEGAAAPDCFRVLGEAGPSREAEEVERLRADCVAAMARRVRL